MSRLKDVTPGVGIELTEDYIYLSEIQVNSEGSILLLNAKTLTTPPKSILKGSIQDFDSLNDPFSKLNDINFSDANVCIGLENDFFSKQTAKLSTASLDELKTEIENRLSNTLVLSNDEFESGFEFLPLSADTTHKIAPTFYAGIRTSTVDSLKEFCETLNYSLFSIELVCRSTVRAITWSAPYNTGLWLVVHLSDNYIDLNVVQNQHILFTHLIHFGLSDFELHPEFMDEAWNTIQSFIYGFTNEMPKSPSIEQVVLFNRTETHLLDRFKLYFKDFQVHIYIPSQHIQSQIDLDKAALLSLVPAIGMSLKAFEPTPQSLSFIRARKHIGSFIHLLDMKQLIISGVIFALVLIVFGSTLAFFKVSSNRIEAKIEKSKDQIRSLQSGEYLLRQKRLEDLQKQINVYSSLRTQAKTKQLFLETIASDLPKDLYFDSVMYQDEKRINIKGASLSQDSIYLFYNKLTKQFSNVRISGISIDTNAIPPNSKFDISFEWN